MIDFLVFSSLQPLGCTLHSSDENVKFLSLLLHSLLSKDQESTGIMHSVTLARSLRWCHCCDDKPIHHSGRGVDSGKVRI